MVNFGHRQDNIVTKTFSNINQIVQFHLAFQTTGSETKIITVPVEDDDDQVYQVPIPNDIWCLIGQYLRGLLKPNIPDGMRNFYQSVRDKSGHKLILLLRSPNKLSQKSITLLKKRRDVLKLTNLGDWPVVRGDLITLIKDWDDEVTRGLIKPDQKWSVDDVKEFMCNEFDDILPGLATFINTKDNENRTIDGILEQCDVLCETEFSGWSVPKSVAKPQHRSAWPWTPSAHETATMARVTAKAMAKVLARAKGYGKGAGKGKGYGKGKSYSKGSSKGPIKGKGPSKGKRTGKGKGSGAGAGYGSSYSSSSSKGHGKGYGYDSGYGQSNPSPWDW